MARILPAYEDRFDTISGKTTAGSIVITGEGNSATTNLQQGLCKAWINLNGTSTIATRDSFNVASITDSGTGLYTVTITNDFNNDDYSTAGAAGENDDSGGNRSLGLRAKSTGAQNIRGFADGVSAQDNQEMCVHIMGDLA